MDVIERLQNLRQELIERDEMERRERNDFNLRVSATLALAEEDVRRSRAEAAARRINLRTEEQVAGELHCSVDSVRRVRKDLNLSYTKSPGGTVCYTEEQYVALLAARERPAKLQAVRSKQAS